MTSTIPETRSSARSTKYVERTFLGLLAFGAVGHTIWTFVLVPIGSTLFVWSLAGSLAVVLVVALNALRMARPTDRTVTRIAVAGSVGWTTIALLFGASIEHVLDPRALVHAIAAAALAVLGARQLAAERPQGSSTPRPTA